VARSPLARPARQPGQMRRLMSTVVAEGEVAAEAAVKEPWMRLSNPLVQKVGIMLGFLYFVSVRSIVHDKRLEAKIAGWEAEKAAAIEVRCPSS